MTERPVILVVDDEDALREVLRMRLARWGFQIVQAASGAEARERALAEDPDLVLSDVVLPDVTGLELLEALREGDPQRPILMMTAHGTVDTAVEAMKLGARDFLTKPLDYDKLKAVLDATLAERDRRHEVRRLDDRLEDGAGLGRLIGTSRAMKRVYEELRLLAESDASAILSGESGTGKELAAATIHDLSARARGPFVAVNCAAIPETLVESELFGHQAGSFTGAIGTRQGCFEQANGGTLLLDEIAEMPVALQPKLLRVLEERRLRRVGGNREMEVDVRVLAATNRDPARSVADGKLREDLYYRLNVFTVELPPLRRRLEDLPLLTQHFLRSANGRHKTTVDGLSDTALERLRGYRWPGNVRELRNVVERGVILAQSGWLESLHLPPFLTAPAAPAVGDDQIVLPTNVTADEAERIVILETLKRVENNKSRAARQLGLDVKTIRNKLKSWGLMGDDAE